MNIKTAAVRIFAILVLLPALLSACAPSQRAEEPTPTPVPTPIVPTKPTYKVMSGEVVRKIEFTGRVVPIVQEELYFKANGRVAKVWAATGDQVKAGQVLAELESNTSAVDVRRAQINVEMAKLSKEMAAIQNNKFSPTYPMLMKMKDYDIELAQLALDEITAKVNTMQIKASFDGTVISTSLSLDKVITAYKSEVVLAKLDQLEVSADLISSTISNLQEGLPVQVYPLSAPGDGWNGAISRLPYPYGKAQASPQVKADSATHISLTEPLSKNRPSLGDLMRVVVILEKKSGVLWLPPQAIRKYEGRQYVVVQDAAGQRRVDIKTGISGDDRVEIVEGLSEGLVIVSP